MNSNLHINELYKALGDKRIVKFEDIDAFYRKITPGISVSTVRWRIHTLVDKKILYSFGHGLYRFGTKEKFCPNTYLKTKTIARIMRTFFPLVDYCQWDLAVVNAFAQHLLNTQIYFVDVERDAVESVYYEIRDRYPRTILYRNLHDDLPYYDGFVVVRNLVTGAPMCDGEKGIPMAALEKILVDLALESAFPFQNSEILRIYENAFSSYAVSKSKMLRYAGRRSRREVIEDILERINY